jgi:hypothetical protein
MKQHVIRASLLFLILAIAVPIGTAFAANVHGRVHAPAASPLFSVGLAGGITGTSMHATVYADGTVSVTRQGASQHPSAQYTVPLTVSSVRQVTHLARLTRVFAIPKDVQNKSFGSDIPIRSFTIYTASGQRTVKAYGSEGSHVQGTAAFFPVWGLLHALAGYPPQLG